MKNNGKVKITELLDKNNKVIEFKEERRIKGKWISAIKILYK